MPTEGRRSGSRCAGRSLPGPSAWTHGPDRASPPLTTHAFQNRLRLVRPPAALVVDDAPARSAPPRENAVARANKAAAMAGDDAMREVFTRRVTEALEGGRSAILRPERRATLVDLGSRMGIRPFDCHLVIALTQDAARRREVELTGTAASTPAPTRDESSKPIPAWALLAAIVLGIGCSMVAIAWLQSG